MTPTRRLRSLCPVVDTFEARLSLSGLVGSHIGTNVVAEVTLPHSNPEPMTTIRGDGDLNPQPLPPGFM